MTPTSRSHFSPDGKTLAFETGNGTPAADGTLNPTGTIGLWDIAQGKVTAALTGHTGGLSGLVFTPDGKNLISSLAPTPCIITANHGAVNLRSGPGTNYNTRGSLASGATAQADGQATDSGSHVWWHLADGTWVRSDVVGEAGDCQTLPPVAAP